MEETDVGRLIRLYDLFCEPVFVKKHGHTVSGYDDKVLTVKTRVSVSPLGTVTLGSVWSSSLNRKKATPVMFISDEQASVLRKHDPRLVLKPRKHPTVEETWMCFPDRNFFEKMISL